MEEGSTNVREANEGVRCHTADRLGCARMPRLFMPLASVSVDEEGENIAGPCERVVVGNEE